MKADRVIPFDAVMFYPLLALNVKESRGLDGVKGPPSWMILNGLHDDRVLGGLIFFFLFLFVFLSTISLDKCHVVISSECRNERKD